VRPFVLTAGTTKNVLIRSMATYEVELAFGGLHFGDIDVEPATCAAEMQRRLLLPLPTAPLIED
jgi:hypothetical protein